MSMKMRYEDSDRLEVMLGSTVNACGEIGLTIQKRAAKIVKTKVVSKLNELRTKTGREDYKHMADDVQIRTTKDRYGGTVVKVSGGRKTGSLWHIVNDGSYNVRAEKRNTATHFMDISLNEVENEIENIIDEELTKAGF